MKVKIKDIENVFLGDTEELISAGINIPKDDDTRHYKFEEADEVARENNNSRNPQRFHGFTEPNWNENNY